MDQKIIHLIDLFASLGERLKTFGSDDVTNAVIDRAIASNPWFTRADILLAIDSIRVQMLDGDKLFQWLEPYSLTPGQGKRIGIIMAGNIPLVGFFDLLCVVVSGGCAVVKCSSKDSVLMGYMIEQLKETEAICLYTPGTYLDAVIATGSDNTNRYFRTAFSSIPSLLRGSRYSVAVLRGDETNEQLSLLADDIFRYSGLGCRNVSRLLVPAGYDFHNLIDVLSLYRHVNPKYRNNYLQNKALQTLRGADFVDGGFFTLRRTTQYSLYISELTYEPYDSDEQLSEWLLLHENQIQCVVGHSDNQCNVPFGKAQSPRLSDYPDAEDVIEFIKKV